jgi:O-antigen ligase
MLLAELFSFLSGERIVFLLFSLINVVAMVAVVRVLRPSRALLGGGLAALLAGAAGLAFFAQTMVGRTIGYFVQQLRSFKETDYYDIFGAAWHLWQNHPWVGVGTRYFSQACTVYHYESRYEGCVVHPHNIYLQWLSENGLIGLGLFLLFLYLLFRQLLRGLDFGREPLLSLMVLVAPLAVFWPVMTSMSMFANNYAGLVWLSVAWAVARSQLAPPTLRP